jgi:hypothetical protein
MSQLSDVLEQFRGKNADEIAAMVKRRGIKGRMGTTYGCPMALLLNQARHGEFVIGRKYVVRRSGDRIEKQRTPRNIEAFVRKFDIGGYPDMVAPPPRCVAKLGDKLRPASKGTRGQRTRPPIKNHLAKLVGRFHGGR